MIIKWNCASSRSLVTSFILHIKVRFGLTVINYSSHCSLKPCPTQIALKFNHICWRVSCTQKETSRSFSLTSFPNSISITFQFPDVSTKDTMEAAVYLTILEPILLTKKKHTTIYSWHAISVTTPTTGYCWIINVYIVVATITVYHYYMHVDDL